VLLPTKYAAVVLLAEEQFMHFIGNLVQLLKLQAGTLRLIFSIKERQNLNREKT
jgi:hypothetical protein